MRNKRSFYWVSGGIIALTGMVSCNTKPGEEKNIKIESKPNILWIVADDLGADLGCYGNTVISTPRLDKLASEGAIYKNFFTVSAVSSPSRSSMITGMYPVSIESHQHRTQFKKPLRTGIYPITKYFREAGYFCTNGNFRNTDKAGKTDYNFIAENIFDGTDWNQRNEGQPFFAQIQINFPHRPFLRDTIKPINEKNIKLPPYYPDHKIARKDWAMYLETIQILDREVGKILDRLKEEGLEDNTVVFFFGDQGRPHVRAKQFLYDSGINTPLIIRWNGKIKAGTISDDLIQNVDLGPTSMQIAGISLPNNIQGQDFMKPEGRKRDFIFSMRDRRDETDDRIRAIRSKDYKFIRNFHPERPYTQFNAYKKQAYPVLTLMQIMYRNGELNKQQEIFMANKRPEFELYDLENDPWELNNLAYKEEYKSLVLDMQINLDDHISKYDLALYPEFPEETSFADSLMKERFIKQMEKKGLKTTSSDEEILEYWERSLFSDN